MVDGETVGEISGGLLALVGATHDDTVEDARAVAAKIAGLRIFADSDQKMNLALADTGGAALVCEPVHPVRGRSQRSPPLPLSMPPGPNRPSSWWMKWLLSCAAGEYP